MIVTFPANYRHDAPFEPSYYEQFLLEKISSLELQVSQMSDSMKELIGIFKQSQQIFKEEHLMVEKIIDIIEKLDLTGFTKAASIDNSEISDKLSNRIIACYDGKKVDLFNRLIRDGFKFHAQKEEKQALGAFERAVIISPKNTVLLTFLGRVLFEQENNPAAAKYLEKARKIAPKDEKILLLSATVYTESERFDDAETCLRKLSNNVESTFCVNFIKGFVLFAKENKLNSLKAFQECMSVLAGAETAYLFGCILYQVNEPESAKRVLKAAVEVEPNFADAWFMLSRACLVLNETSAARDYLKKAAEAKDSRSQCFEFLTGKKEFPTVALPFIKSKFFLKGSKRLSELFKKELDKILNS
jgi:tetratricopeptide (TPR) repeat protein